MVDILSIVSQFRHCTDNDFCSNYGVDEMNSDALFVGLFLYIVASCTIV